MGELLTRQREYRALPLQHDKISNNNRKKIKNKKKPTLQYGKSSKNPSSLLMSRDKAMKEQPMKKYSSQRTSNVSEIREKNSNFLLQGVDSRGVPCPIIVYYHTPKVKK